MKKLLTYTILMLFAGSVSFGQTNKELMKMGDAAMVTGEYTNAIHYYSYILFKIQQGDDAAIYPFEVTTSYKEPETDDNGAVKPPENPSDKEITVIHKLSDAYRLAYDYHNAEIWYTNALEHPKEQFPYARYFYGICLMYKRKVRRSQRSI